MTKEEKTTLQKQWFQTHWLSELLNPNETHKLGYFFLESFVNQRVKIDVNLDFANAKVSVNHSISDMNIEIELLFKNPDYTILILESKLETGNQASQIMQYADYAKNNYDGNYIILYLTKHGQNPSEYPKKDGKIVFKSISYRTDIRNWLTKCIDKLDARPVLRVTLEQYIESLEEVTAD